MNICSFDLKNFLRKSFISSILMGGILLSLTAVAQDNVISSVTISKSKDKLNAYELMIDSTEAVPFKSVNYENGVYFDLKNSEVSSDIGTIYDEVTDIDNVTVKQLKNKVRIYVQGRHAKNTDLVFSDSYVEKRHTNQNRITLNKPMNEYKQIHEVEEDFEEYNDWDNNAFNLGHLFKNLKEGVLGLVLIVLTILSMFAWVVKTLALKMSQEEPLIGLNKSKNEENIMNLTDVQKLYYVNNSLNRKPAQIQPSFKKPVIKKQDEDMNLEDISKLSKSEKLQYAQAQLAQAHKKYQDYVKNKYGSQSIKKPINVDAIKQGIALNQYQKSTQNPYKNQEVIKMDNLNRVTSEISNGFQIPPRPKAPQPAPPNYIKRENRAIKSNMTEQKSSSMNFLESVSKIYQDSGRADLADELKNSMTKIKSHSSL